MAPRPPPATTRTTTSVTLRHKPAPPTAWPVQLHLPPTKACSLCCQRILPTGRTGIRLLQLLLVVALMQDRLLRMMTARCCAKAPGGTPPLLTAYLKVGLPAVPPEALRLALALEQDVGKAALMMKMLLLLLLLLLLPAALYLSRLGTLVLPHDRRMSPEGRSSTRFRSCSSIP